MNWTEPVMQSICFKLGYFSGAESRRKPRQLDGVV